jgi:hypothetical protein
MLRYARDPAMGLRFIEKFAQPVEAPITNSDHASWTAREAVRTAADANWRLPQAVRRAIASAVR